uniref:Uncharacterized protein n=1 Tax=Davidia involucrata TaxID=16924 RepID=A0A5B6YVU8_DAVIN
MDYHGLNFGLSTSSEHITLEPPYDDHIDVEDIEEDDDLKSELVCPFCSEDFDLVGLCCHIDDEHPEAKTGVCPICAAKVGMTMAGHIIMKHEYILKTLHKKKLRTGESHSTLFLLRKELEDEHLQSLLEGSSHVVSSSNMAPDPLLSSFIYNPSTADEPEIMHPSSSTEASLAEESSDENMLERKIQPSPLSHKDQEEKTQRCVFVRGILFSTILDDNL